MIRHIDTKSAPKPFSNYSQAVAVSADAELIFVSGQVGVGLDGALVEGEEGQHRQIWRNILALLEAASLGPHDIIEVTAYVTDQNGVAVYRQVRDAMLDGAKPASTLLVVAGLADPTWLAEISVTAAKKS